MCIVRPARGTLRPCVWGDRRVKLDLRKIATAVSAWLSAKVSNRLMSGWMSVLRSHPVITDGWGYHIRRINHYEPLPDFRSITHEMLQRRRDFPGIDFAWDGQVALLERLTLESTEELTKLAERGRFDFLNPYFNSLDACSYFALIRHLKPQRIVEIGSGYSTRIASLAVERNIEDGFQGELVCIEPYPEPRLTQSNAKFTLIKAQVQTVPMAYFEELGENDILFIDSSHVVTTGGDVCYEFLEILPRLKAGVWVHVHDIFFPCDYPADWVIGARIAWNEQYILEAFLSGNSAFAPKLAHNWLMLDFRDQVEKFCPAAVFSNNDKRYEGSFWMKRESR